MILDGEIVAFDAAGKPSFNALQNRGAGHASVFYCFDLLHFAGVDLRKAPYATGGATSRSACCPRRWCSWCTPPRTASRCTAAALASGFEGVVGKRKDSRYEAGKRSPAWLKVKATQQRRLRRSAATPPGKGSRAPLGALLVGYWDGDKLRYASHVGSGFDDAHARAGEGAARAAAHARPARSPRSPRSTRPTHLGRARGWSPR